MPNQKKIFTVANLAEKIKQAKGLILTDYAGLNVDQLGQLRVNIKQAGGEYEVVKNRLLQLAAKGSTISLAPLSGPTAALWIYKTDPAPLKALDQFIQETTLPKIKWGFWDGQELSEEKIQTLARLPGLAELRQKLIGNLLLPLAGLTNALNWNIKKLILVLKNKK